ncbi:MAG: PEGA domain-containing protein [Myxococcales bacterium]|nr:PEGA domain-containing protein [Myxococcales bacterium]
MESPKGIVSHSAIALLVGVALVLLFAGGARGEASSDETQRAKALFRKANVAFDAGRYGDALASYRASFALVKHARTAYNIAFCLDRIGKHEAAYTAYLRFVELAPASESKLLAAAHKRVVALRASLRLPVHVAVFPAGASVARLGEGGRARVLGLAPLTVNLPLGRHTLRLSAPGHTPKSATIDVAAGQRNRVDVRLVAVVAKTVVAKTAIAKTSIAKTSIARKEARPAPAPARPDGWGALRIAATAALVVGVTLTGLGVWQGVHMAQKNSALDDEIAAGRWKQDLHDEASAAQTRMAVLFGAAGVSAAACVVLYLLSLRRPASSKVSFGVGAHPSGASVSARLRF